LLLSECQPSCFGEENRRNCLQTLRYLPCDLFHLHDHCWHKLHTVLLVSFAFANSAHISLAVVGVCWNCHRHSNTIWLVDASGSKRRWRRDFTSQTRAHALWWYLPAHPSSSSGW